MADVLVVGAGVAGFSAAERLAESNVSVSMFESEARLPYKRTKISKNIASSFGPDEFALREPSWYEDQSIRLHTGDSIATLDIDSKRAVSAAGLEIAFGNLLVATGGRPKRLSVGDMQGLNEHVVHSQTDVEQLKRSLVERETILVAGGGVLGVEVAEQLQKLGHAVSLLCAHESLMPGQLDAEASEQLKSLFDDAGIELMFDRHVQGISAVGGSVEVDLFSERKRYSRVVSCIGIEPNVELAAEAGIEVRKGIVVDEQLRTSRDGVWAAGDVAEHAGGTITRLWHAAEHQGRVAADSMTGSVRSDAIGRFRLKCEVFGHYFFSLTEDLPGSNGRGRAQESTVERVGGIYRRIWFREDAVVGIAMVDDGERAKLYEKAVREGWRRTRLAAELPIGVTN